MTRPRLVLVAVAVVVLGAAWWLLADGLSAEERRLVGTWQLCFAGEPTSHRMVLSADRRGRPEVLGDDDGFERTPCRWSAGQEVLVFDSEPSPSRRILRPVAPHMGLRVAPASRFTVEWRSADLIFIHGADGSSEEWERVRDE